MKLSTKLPLLLTAALAATAFCCATPEKDQPAPTAQAAPVANAPVSTGSASWLPGLVASFRVDGMQKNAAGGT